MANIITNTYRRISNYLYDKKYSPSTVVMYGGISTHYVNLRIWTLNGRKHRDGAPAQIYYKLNGSVEAEIWYKHGKLHRENGPAEDWEGHSPYGYFLLGEEYSKEGFEGAIQLANEIRSDKNKAILNIRHNNEFIRSVSKEVLDGTTN